MNKKTARKNFREAVFARDGHACVFCGATESLDAHHITDRSLMPNGGYTPANGITLCPEHHLDAEAWHRAGQREWVEDMHPFELYEKIGSSLSDALFLSEALGFGVPGRTRRKAL